MGNISVSLPSDGETIDAADYNTPITTIVNAINGGLDNANIASGAAIDGSKLADGSILTAKLSDAAVTADKTDFSTFVAKSASLSTTLSPITTTFTSVGSITVPETGNYLVITSPAVNWNNATLNTFRVEVYNSTSSTSLAGRAMSLGPGDYIRILSFTEILSLTSGHTLQARYKIDSGTAGSNYTTSPGNIILIRVGTKTS